jgi:hypothetical protein
VSDLARKVDALVRAAPDGTPILHVQRLSGPSPVAGNQPQRMLMFDVIQRGTNL